MKPRVLLVGRNRYRLPLAPGLDRKFSALDEVFDLRVIGSAPDGSPSSDSMFHLVSPLRPRALDGLAFFARLPVHVARELARFEPDVVIVQGAHEAASVLLGRALARSDARVILEVHGDWRTATRLYGSPARRLLSPIADLVAALALRRADGVRTVSEYTSALVRRSGVEPAGVFPAFMDLDPFLEPPPEPLPTQAAALFVGVLELYKNVDGLADAWRRAAPRLPEAELRIVGRGARDAVVEALVRELPAQTSWQRELSADEVARELDRAWFLVLPSRSEGMGRVIVEAFCRGRPVLATRVGGIVDLVDDGVNGVLLEPGDTPALADALVQLLSDRKRVERLAAGARASADRWLATPEEYASRVAALVDRVTVS